MATQHDRMLRTFRWLIPLSFALTAVACSVALNQDAAQCATDDDCAKFGGHPYCNGGLCVASGLGPQDCFFGTPSTPAQFLNQCSAAQCFASSDCAQQGTCDAGLADAALIPPPPPSTGSSTPPAEDAGTPSLPAYPNCIDVDAGRGNVVVITGSSNFPTTLALVAPLVIDAGYVPIFQTTNSCTGVNSVFSGAAPTNTLQDPTPGPSAKYAQFYNPDGTSQSCLFGPGGAVVDVGESDIFSETCGLGQPPSGIGEWLGPIQAMAFVVPGNSTESAIDTAAARAVFGMGGATGLASPWVNPNHYFVRSSSTGTQQMIGHAIGVPASQFWGISESSATGVAAAVLGADEADVNTVIGILSVDVYDAKRPNLKALAFRADDQECAYLPDSTLFKTDKQNVRDGHYPIWGPIHFFSQVSGSSASTPQAAAFIGAVAPPKLNENLIAAMSASSLVPDCAMQVTRQTELGPLASYSPESQCTCFFLYTVNGQTVPSDCKSCRQNTDCTDPTRPSCNYGYCEAR